MSDNGFINLTHNELSFLAQRSNKMTLIGFTEDYLAKPVTNSEKIVESLLTKGLFIKEGDVITDAPLLNEAVSALLTPTKAVIVVKDQPGVGIKKVVFVRSNDQYIMHLQPSEGMHGIKFVKQEDVYPALLAWYRIDFEKNQELKQISIRSDRFDQLLGFVDVGSISQAEGCFEHGDDELSKKRFIEGIKSRSFSGSLSTFSCLNNEAVNGFSFSIVVGIINAWLITKDKNDHNLFSVDPIGKEFEAFLNTFVERFTGRLAGDFESYILSTETLSYALSLINRPDVGQSILKEKYPELTSDKLREIYQKAFEVLKEANLCKVMKDGNVTLDSMLEKAVFPIAKNNLMIQAEITRVGLHSTAKIYVQNNGYFTSIIDSNKKIALEFGETRLLPKYLSLIYATFGEGKSVLTSDTEIIHLDTLMNLISSTANTSDVDNPFATEKLTEATKKDLLQDIQNHKFRAVIQKIERDSKFRIKNERSTLLLLQGQERNWIFEFSDTSSNPSGKIHIVNREGFIKSLDQFINN